MVRHSPRWIWAGRGVFGLLTTGLVAYIAVAGVEKANMLVSSVGAVVALLALGAPYLLPTPKGAPMSEEDRVEDSGDAKATGGGQATTGADLIGEGPARVIRSGDATAEGPGSTATSGIVRRPRP